METHLQWFVPATARVSTPTGSQLLHDDRLVSAALVDRLVREGRVVIGRAESRVNEGYDPVEDLPDW